MTERPDDVVLEEHDDEDYDSVPGDTEPDMPNEHEDDPLDDDDEDDDE